MWLLVMLRLAAFRLLLVDTCCFQVLHHNTLSSIQPLPQLPGGH